MIKTNSPCVSISRKVRNKKRNENRLLQSAQQFKSYTKKLQSLEQYKKKLTLLLSKFLRMHIQARQICWLFDLNCLNLHVDK